MGVPDGAHGKASISVDGIVKNSGVPAKVIAAATDWIVGNQVTVQAEWTKMNNPRKRQPMKKQAARLQSVSTEKGMIVNAVYSDGRTLRVNLSEVAKRLHAFAPLEKPSEFATAKVADFGWTLEWDCGASLDSDRLIELALEQTGMTENVYFRRWQDANGLSLTDAAKAIGLTRRTVSQYRTGARPVPRVVGLACKGWEVEHAQRAA